MPVRVYLHVFTDPCFLPFHTSVGLSPLPSFVPGSPLGFAVDTVWL